MSHGKPAHDPTLAKLVERQMCNWELSRAQRQTIPSAKRSEVEDFLTISRCVGIDGKSVAAALGSMLGWPVFDKEILHVMAGDDEIRQRIYESMDERDLSWCEEALRAVTEPEFIKNDYFHRLTDTVLSLARQGCAIFLGRGSDLILPRSVGFRVRLVAPTEWRVARFARERGMAADEAREEVAQLEHERSEFIRHHFHVDANDPSRYDVVINMARFTTEQTVDLILAARSKPRPGGAGT